MTSHATALGADQCHRERAVLVTVKSKVSKPFLLTYLLKREIYLILNSHTLWKHKTANAPTKHMNAKARRGQICIML